MRDKIRLASVSEFLAYGSTFAFAFFLFIFLFIFLHKHVNDMFKEGKEKEYEDSVDLNKNAYYTFCMYNWSRARKPTKNIRMKC